MVLRTFALELQRPLGIGLSATNIVTEVDPKHATAPRNWQVGDALVWLDGTEVRGGCKPVREALRPDLQTHTFIVQRLMQETPGKQFFSLKLRGDPGLGIGLTDRNYISDLGAGRPAAADGRLQVPPRASLFLARVELPPPLPPLPPPPQPQTPQHTWHPTARAMRHASLHSSRHIRLGRAALGCCRGHHHRRTTPPASSSLAHPDAPHRTHAP